MFLKDPDEALSRLRVLSEALVADPSNVENVAEFRRTFDGLDAWLCTGGFAPRHWASAPTPPRPARQPRQPVRARTLRVKPSAVKDGDFVFAQHIGGSEIDEDFIFAKAEPFSNPQSGLTQMLDTEGIRRAVVGNDDKVKIERSYAV
jgi:hypothetical protein